MIWVCLLKLIMCDFFSVENPAFKKEIGVSVLMPMRFNTSLIYVFGIIGDMFKIIILLA